ncbi:MAG: hypothetical protein JWO30_4369 [Fibrobacteres bacterium]|nr:hypothetical protein [Fibrobacterota bacterium]
MFAVTCPFGNTCLDSAYLRMRQSKLNEISSAEFALYQKLDSLCNSEKAIESIGDTSNGNEGVQKPPTDLAKSKPAPPKDPVQYNYRVEPYSSESEPTGRGKATGGRGWFWAALGIGGAYFIGSAMIMSAIDDDCSLIFITDLFKSAEQCKEDADRQRSAAGTGMALGGLLSLVGVVGLSATKHGK